MQKHGLLGLILIIFILPILGLGFDDLLIRGADFLAPSEEKVTQSSQTSHTIIISQQRKKHILYGDRSGGGHMHGVGKPCKSEFPADWNEEEILDTVKRIAANDNLPWEKQNNGYHVAESYEGKTRVRVVLGPQKQKIITAYPTNVKRNPCPANDR